jgi:hypothetical protein
VRRAASFALLLLLASASPARAEAPDEKTPTDPPVAIAVVSGVATTLLPMVLGATYTAAHQTDGARNVGVTVSGMGPVLAPIVAHAVLGEWKRAAAFAALPAACEIGIASFLTAQPDAVFHGTVGTRTLFGLLYSFDIFSGALGIVDAMMVRDRARFGAPRGTAGLLGSLVLSPSFGPGRAGLAIGGSL